MPVDFLPTAIGITCSYARPASDGKVLLLQLDTSSPYAELTAQKINTDGKVFAMCTIKREPEEKDMGMDNAYVMEGFTTAKGQGDIEKRLSVTYFGYNNNFDRFKDLEECR